MPVENNEALCTRSDFVLGLSNRYEEIFAQRVSNERGKRNSQILDTVTLQRIRVESHEELHVEIRAELERDKCQSSFGPIVFGMVLGGIAGYTVKNMTCN